MSDPHNFPPDWLKDGWAFILAIVGWVWHAGRLASKVDILDKKVDSHLDDEERWRRENTESHEKIIAKLEKFADKYYDDRNHKKL